MIHSASISCFKCPAFYFSIYNYILSILEGRSHSEGTDTDSELSDDSQYSPTQNNVSSTRVLWFNQYSSPNNASGTHVLWFFQQKI
jgi:hypothetical protein